MTMNVFLVGGAVRDSLLGLPVVERDWVVVGCKPNDLLNLGYQQVGKDFPVFLHPETKEEYALARIERKIAPGHDGFDCDAGEHVTLEDDLLRRDLTINAIAQTPNGDLIDPYHGAKDLDDRILRHVSPAFSEDPLRVLRLARFYAKFHHFEVAPETLALCQKMVSDNQLDELPAERIWQEIEKALSTSHPNRFFELLEKVGADQKLWEMLSPATSQHLAISSRHTQQSEMRLAFALMTLDTKNITEFLHSVKAPKRYGELAIGAAHYWRRMMETDLDAEQVIQLLYDADAFRRTSRFDKIIELVRIKSAVEEQPLHQDWRKLFDLVAGIGIKHIDANIQGQAIGAAIRSQRLLTLKAFLKSS